MMRTEPTEVDAPIDSAAACATLHSERQAPHHTNQPRIPLEILRRASRRLEKDNASNPDQCEFYKVDALASREAQCIDLAESAPPTAARVLAIGVPTPPPTPPPSPLSPDPGCRSCCSSSTGSMVTAVKAKRAMHLRFPPRAERSLQRSALGDMPAINKHNDTDHLSSVDDDRLSVSALAPDTNLDDVRLLRRSSSCAPPASPALETVHEESTSTGLYTTWYLGSRKMQSCDTEGKVRGGMAFGPRRRAMAVPDASPRFVHCHR